LGVSGTPGQVRSATLLTVSFAKHVKDTAASSTLAILGPARSLCPAPYLRAVRGMAQRPAPAGMPIGSFGLGGIRVRIATGVCPLRT